MTLKIDSVQITPEILTLVSEIDEFKGASRALGTLAPERLSALRRVATIESIGSSIRIEGSKLTDVEVERRLANLDIKCFESRNEQEVAGYAQVKEMVFAHFDAIDLTENHVTRVYTQRAKPASLARGGDFHGGFFEIHPFQDGNGRLSRVLTTLLLMRSGSVIENSKDGYYLALRFIRKRKSAFGSGPAGSLH
ncbi:Fic family protein [Mesorhizobium sp. RIZ17]|uniref:Fic family protein n=1 Tax=Mesorhizobium sp. RIZ17 TaxID=3132743 RepID=UPI003DA98F34